MKKSSAPNERIKREYFIWLKEAKGRNEASIDGVAKALHRFETYTRFRDFKQFHVEQVKGFKAHLGEQMNARTSKRLSAATLFDISRFEGVLSMVGGKARLQVAGQLCRYGIFQPIRKGNPHRNGAPPEERAGY
jgi:hypothetical protein